MKVACEIWEKSIIPSLLFNCGSWVGISKTSIKTLDALQNLYCRLIYSCPDSTPLPALRGEAGLLYMEHRIMREKICLVTSILNLREEEDAKEILKEQLQMGWEELTKEVVDMCKKIGLPNGCEQLLYREKVNEAI